MKAGTPGFVGARLKAVRQPFNPEGGAYVAPPGEHAPEHAHEHDHDQP